MFKINLLKRGEQIPSISERVVDGRKGESHLVLKKCISVSQQPCFSFKVLANIIHFLVNGIALKYSLKQLFSLTISSMFYN